MRAEEEERSRSCVPRYVVPNFQTIFRTPLSTYHSPRICRYDIHVRSRGVMHPLVRNLYKRFLVVGKDYPLGLAFVRRKAKEGIRKNAHLTDDREIRLAVHRGRGMCSAVHPSDYCVNRIVKELQGVVQLKKYRTMRQRYPKSNLDPQDQASGVRYSGEVPF
eukprot:g34077.t1